MRIRRAGRSVVAPILSNALYDTIKIEAQAEPLSTMPHNPDKEFALSKIKRSYAKDECPTRAFMTFRPCTFSAYYIRRCVGDNEFAGELIWCAVVKVRFMVGRVAFYYLKLILISSVLLKSEIFVLFNGCFSP